MFRRLVVLGGVIAGTLLGPVSESQAQFRGNPRGFIRSPTGFGFRGGWAGPVFVGPGFAPGGVAPVVFPGFVPYGNLGGGFGYGQGAWGNPPWMNQNPGGNIQFSFYPRQNQAPGAATPAAPPPKMTIREFDNQGREVPEGETPPDYVPPRPAEPKPEVAPPPQGPPVPADRARIEVIVPAGATLWFEGVQTKLTGERRQFITPQLTPGQEYIYEVRAEWKGEDGQKVSETQRLRVQPGKQMTVDFTKTGQR
jgi:uncharacterized protein (TIGR03000 family)